jgi:hypothetical protein
MKNIEMKYIAHPTLRLFHAGNSRFRGVMGPRYSGKSTAMTKETGRRMREQKPGKDGIRRSRWVVVRNTYVELKDTTVPTWLYWHREEWFGKFNYNNMVHKIKFNDVEAEVMFRALDHPGDIGKLLSLEITGAWVNEARAVPKGLIDALDDAVGRYPPIIEGGATWAGIMMDTNPPDDDHWWYKLSEEERPEGWEFWKQPGALIERDGEFIPNPKAENLEFIRGGINWYLDRVPGKKKEHILCYYCGEYVFVTEGKSIHPDYVDSIHCPGIIFEPMKGIPIIIGQDFGLTPAATFHQRLPNGRWICFDELVTERMGISAFCDELGPKLRGEYAGLKIEKIWSDPSGKDPVQTDENTCIDMMIAKGLPAAAAPTNDFTLRTEALNTALCQMIEGKPRFMISPKCKITRKGLAGGYCFKRKKIAGVEQYHSTPDKNRYSHPVESVHYAMMGAGEGDQLIETDTPKINIDTKIPYNLQQHAQGWMM